MPTISYFYGITIVMYFTSKEHQPPHLHAVMQDCVAPFSIIDGELLAGVFPSKAKSLVKEFILKNQKALLKMWEEEVYYKLPPL